MNLIYNCIVVFNNAKDRALFCRRRKDPYQGLYNFVGGKVEPGETSEAAAYRELYEETGITGGQIRLYRLMDIRYYHQGFDLQIYVGKLEEDVPLTEETNPLLWLPLTEDFTDKSRFAGEQNIAHIMNVALEYPIPGRTMMTDGRYVGIDGCSKGWIAVTLDYGQVHIKRHAALTEIIDDNPLPATFLIDMPIRLPENFQDRRPEADARKALGERRSTIFSVPCRQAVQLTDQNREAREEVEEGRKEINKQVLKKSLSKQTLVIIPKIKEVDDFLQTHTEYKDILFESHPELCSARLKGSVLKTKKSRADGAEERTGILSQFIKDERLKSAHDLAKEIGCKPDDILDAACLAVTAALKAHDLTATIPESPDKDARDLSMQMVVPNMK